MRLRILLAALVLTLGGLVATAVPVAAAPISYRQVIQSEAAYVASAQLTAADGCTASSPALGAIAANQVHPRDTSAYVSPYQSSYGAFALVLGGPAYWPDALAYARWYLRNVNYYASQDTYQGVSGSIFDFHLDPAACSQASTGEYDSSDAYAGVFLSLCYRLAQVYPPAAALFRASTWNLSVIANAVKTTINANGLSSALRSLMPVGEYTEDNVETSQGLADYAVLLGTEGNSYSRGYWAGIAGQMRTGIADYEWLASAGAYRDAADQASAGWSPCGAGVISMWPAWDLLNTPAWREAAVPAYDAANGAGWTDTTPGYPDISCPDHDTGSGVAYAAAQAGNSLAATWLASTQADWADAGHPYPWVVADSGLRAVIAYVLAAGKPWVI